MKKKKMTNKESKNVHNDEYIAERQATLETKAKGLVDFMEEEPKARLIPNLRVTEQGIMPDVRLVLVDKEEENDTDSTTEEGSEAEAGEGGEPTTSTEPSESQG